MKKILFLGLLFIALGNAQERSIINSRVALKELGILSGTHLALNLAHELGHVIVSKFLLYAGQIAPDPTTKIELQNNALFPLCGTYPRFAKSFNNILVELAGPAAGLLAAYCWLKGANIFSELNKNVHPTEAVKNGFKKRLFNSQQSLALRAAIAFNIFGNLATLIPSKNPFFNDEHGESLPLHGYTLLQELGLIQKS